jgi:hypothetical protein
MLRFVPMFLIDAVIRFCAIVRTQKQRIAITPTRLGRDPDFLHDPSKKASRLRAVDYATV